ncbi:MAG: arginine--tRNA ligase [Bacteroidota bacterium]|nr:arginine--tRNA ligase [Candidatus Kapabacteria bacterium]MDW8220831.1 arginine--tRNA ligase [Bacteroidota bacterium]
MKSYLVPILRNAVIAFCKTSNIEAIPEVSIETPRNPEHGDVSTTVAMVLAKSMRKNPRDIAYELVEMMRSMIDIDVITDISVAGAGFINIRFAKHIYGERLREALHAGAAWGRNTTGHERRVNVEYVSANPTGLLHVGHGRNAAIGDTIANILEWNGYAVTREYYFNNAGSQMANLGRSVYMRYLQLWDSSIEFGKDEPGLYHGDYVKDIARVVAERYADTLKEPTEENLRICRKIGEEWCFEAIRKTMQAMNIRHDVYFNEDSLYTEGKIEEVIALLRSRGLVYEKDGALWLALSRMGLSDDRVIVKSSGEPTYRLPDIAYHYDKLVRRKFDMVVDVFGADHIATIPDVIAAVEALGADRSKIRVVIHQFVTLMKDGEQVKMSKRTGKNYTLDDLLQEFGADVTRFFFLMRGVSTHLEFDLNLAAEQSEKNPVFYLQYAHARIASILRTAEERGVHIQEHAETTLLTHPTEIDLIKCILRFPEVVERAAELLEPQGIAEFLRELAAVFHKFYHDCRILGEEEKLMQARFGLVKAAKQVLNNGLRILGITAPEKM